MYFSLIGMSGSGKTSLSMKLSELGFRHICCDGMIAEKLGDELKRRDGTIMDLSEWMGFPYEQHYEKRESKYLACEIEILDEILNFLESNRIDSQENIVIDTTGSVIYTGDKVVKRLRRNTKVLHLATPPEVWPLMLNTYLSKPRPILWRSAFRKEQTETNLDALARCYPKLLYSREQLYKTYANITIDYNERNQKDFNIIDLLKEISVLTL